MPQPNLRRGLHRGLHRDERQPFASATTASAAASMANDIADAERPVEALAELDGDQIAEHGDLAADQERRHVVARRDQEAEDESGDAARAGSAARECRSESAKRPAPRSRAASSSMSLMPRIEP